MTSERAHTARARLRSMLELELLPRAVAALPWRFGHRVARMLARMPALYREPVSAATRVAERYGWCDDARRRSVPHVEAVGLGRAVR